MIPHEVFLFLAFAVFVICIGLIGMEDEDRADARRRNPTRTWDDEG